MRSELLSSLVENKRMLTYKNILDETLSIYINWGLYGLAICESGMVGSEIVSSTLVKADVAVMWLNKGLGGLAETKIRNVSVYDELISRINVVPALLIMVSDRATFGNVLPDLDHDRTVYCTSLSKASVEFLDLIKN